MSTKPKKSDKSSQPRRGNRRRKLITKMLPVLVSIIAFVRVYLDYAIDWAFSLYYNSRRRSVPALSDELVLQSAVSLAKKIREGKLTSERVVRAYADRIRAVNPVVNAVVDSRLDEAVEEAKRIDEDIGNGRIGEGDFEKRPFLGVPFTTKESTHCKGMRISFGLLCRKDKVAEEDAAVVAAMKKAGGILLGVTNVPVLNMWQETSNPVYGITNNPYDTTRNVGGSSGGEAAIVASCGSPISIGSDIGGSIRIPAFMCGVFGHKPSPDLISTKGLTYRRGDEGRTMVTAGVMARYADELAPLYKVLLGDRVGRLRLDETVDVANVEVYFVFESGDPRCSTIRREMCEAFARVIRHFKNISDNPPKSLSLPNVRYGQSLWRHWMTREPNYNYQKQLTDNVIEINPYKEILQYILGRSEFNAAVIVNLIDKLLPQVDGEWAERLTEDLRNEIISILGDNGVLLYPSAPWPASYHHTALLRPWNYAYFAIWNALQLPVTQVPLGLSSEGLPLGIQVVAGPYQDHLCLAVAKELEHAFGGYVSPSQVADK